MAKTTIRATSKPPTVSKADSLISIRMANARAARTGNYHRRPNEELIREYEDKIIEATEKFQETVATCQTKIDRLRSKQINQTEVQEVAKGYSPDQLKSMLEDSQRQQRILRQALKSVG